jgi:signal transduction histidine kinase
VVNFNEELETKVQERTRELQEAYEILSELDRNKSDFIQVVSHELRTPLTLIQGYSQLLGIVPQIPAEYQQYIAGIMTGSVRMHQIINSMLDMAKIDNQTLHLSVNLISLPMIVNQLREHFDPILQERKLCLEIKFQDKFPNLEGDEDLLRKVFHHLLTNAVKYTPDGGKITITGRQVDPHHIEVAIKDTGIGIAPEFQQLIFDKFYRVGKAALHSSSNSKFKGGGPGLGLAIAKGIVHAHGGHIWVESEGYNEEKCPGSCFMVVLPLELPKILEPIPEEELIFN